jgi:hypothetical protein
MKPHEKKKLGTKQERKDKKTLSQKSEKEAGKKA